MTVLMKAVSHTYHEGQENMIAELLRYGADTKAVNADGATALEIAVRTREDIEDWEVTSSETQHYIEVQKSTWDSIIQMLTLHSQSI